MVIGDEILTGKVNDINTIFFASELTKLGVAVKRIHILPDEVPIVADYIKRSRSDCDFVLTSGGVGPTHDDVTMEAVAEAFESPLVQRDELVQVISRRYPDEIPEAVAKMTLAPADASFYFADDFFFPLIYIQNVYIFPGEPSLLKKKFEGAKELFRTTPYHLRRVYVSTDEFAIALPLGETQRAFPNVAIGSYPKLGRDDYKGILTFQGKDADKVSAAVADFLGRIDGRLVVRVE